MIDGFILYFNWNNFMDLRFTTCDPIILGLANVERTWTNLFICEYGWSSTIFSPFFGLNLGNYFVYVLVSIFNSFNAASYIGRVDWFISLVKSFLRAHLFLLLKHCFVHANQSIDGHLFFILQILNYISILIIGFLYF